MKRNLLPVVASLALLMLIAPAWAGGPGHTHDSKALHACLEGVLDVFGGEAVSVKYKTERGRAIYDFDVRDPEGTLWEVECDAETRRIVEIEREVAADDPAFAERAEITEEEARERLLAVYPGTVVGVEYEISGEGRPVYEFLLEVAGGGRLTVEVDAIDSGIGDVSVIHWKIGPEEMP